MAVTIDRLPKGYVFTMADFIKEVKRVFRNCWHRMNNGSKNLKDWQF
jgi:hypothetical protein